MKSAAKITCAFVGIGGVLLTNGWDHHARKRAAANFKLAWAPMEARHRMAFEIHEEGKLTFEEYLGLVIFDEKRPFTRAQFRTFMLSQSKPHPRMIQMVADLKISDRLKIVVISNESRELNTHRIGTFKLGELVDFFVSSCFVQMRSRTRISSGLHWTWPKSRPGRLFISRTRRCSLRSRKGLEFEAYFTPASIPRAQN